MRVAAAPCSWGILEFDEAKGEGATWQRMLDEMHEAGYVGTELGDYGFLPTEPEVLRAETGRRELEVMAAFVPINYLSDDAVRIGAARAVEIARLLETQGERPFIVLADDNGTVATRTRNAGRITREMSLSESQMVRYARGVEVVAEQVRRETKARVVFHHHCAGYVETPWEVDALLERTSPELVGLCFDTGHYAFGGGDPLEGLERHRERIWHVHLKDFDPSVVVLAEVSGWDYFESVRKGVFPELGRGLVPFAPIMDRLRSWGYDGWLVVEQDVLPGMGTPFDSARRNRAFVRKLGY